MLVIPAIDLKDGRCVRLFQGDYQQVTVFADDPVAVAQRWQSEGADWLHVVDLDGARDGHSRQLAAVEAIVAGTSLRVQLGGGLRTLTAIEAVFAAGVSRVVLGTVAVEDRAVVEEAVARWPGQIAVGLDARSNRVATRGWLKESAWSPVDLARELVGLGVRHFVFTDVQRDGTLTEPNYAATAELIAALPADTAVFASGGISTVEQLVALEAIGVAGAIVGRALYTGNLTLAEAFRAVGTRDGKSPSASQAARPGPPHSSTEEPN